VHRDGEEILAPMIGDVVDKAPLVGKVVRDMCPASPGGKDWNPSAFSPKTGLLYLPHNNLCMDLEEVQANYIEGTPYVGAEVRMKAGPGGHRGVFSAWDIAAAKEKYAQYLDQTVGNL